MATTVSPERIKATRLAGGKRNLAVREGVASDRAYPVEEAVKLVKSKAKAKFDETIEISMNLGVDPKHADQMVRGVCRLPNGSSRTARVAVFARGPKAEEARAALRRGRRGGPRRASLQGADPSTAASRLPTLMGLVGRLGKVLGPRGLMPNPRVGTVTMDVAGAVRGAKAARSSSASKAGIVHAGVGKASFTEQALVENIKAFVDAVAKAKPQGAKGTYIRRCRSARPWGRA